MKSETITVQQLFQDRRQYMVPFYQRAYVWSLQNQWAQLWEDIRAKAETRTLGGRSTAHFLGAVVLDPQPQTGLIGVASLHIIDGQQRLTTLQFILKAIHLLLKSKEMPLASIVESNLLNSNPDTMTKPELEKYKVWPTFRDRQDYVLAISAESQDLLREAFPKSFTQKQTLRRVGIRHPSAFECIWSFFGHFEQWVEQEGDENSADRLTSLTEAILQDLKVVSITLDEADDAQVIFETLNGRGAQLHATDLIRNFVFMRADREGTDSEKLYDDYWSRFEEQYWNVDQRRGRSTKPRIEWFIHAALQAELHEEIDLGRLYFEYRRYVFAGTEPISAESQLEFLNTYADVFKILVDGEGEHPLARFGRRIAPWDVTTLYPLALYIGTMEATEAEQTEMLDVLVSYIVRRAVCGLTAKNYNNVFMTMLRRLSATELPNPTQFVEIVRSLDGEASRWPTDGEFLNACKESSLYPGMLDTPKMRAFLTELETALRDEARAEDLIGQDTSHLDIDHIMPKSWYQFWPIPGHGSVTSSEAYAANLQAVSGLPLDSREEAVHRREANIRVLGNLTLLNLSVNREAQNKAFNVKRNLLLKNTNLRLSIPLIECDDWDESAIEQRGEKLGIVAVSLWSR